MLNGYICYCSVAIGYLLGFQTDETETDLRRTQILQTSSQKKTFIIPFHTGDDDDNSDDDGAIMFTPHTIGGKLSCFVFQSSKRCNLLRNLERKKSCT